MNTTVKAITYTDVNQVAVREYTLGERGPADIVVKTRYTMVSTGTELRVLGGHYGASGNYPLIPGYSSVGEVVQVGSEVSSFRVGDLVSCRNPKPLPGVTSMFFPSRPVLWAQIMWACSLPKSPTRKMKLSSLSI